MIKRLDGFSKNLLIVFIGSTVGNVFNLLSQLLIAHKLEPSDFAAFNSLLSIFVLISAPMSTLQTSVVKYTADYNAHKRTDELKFLLSEVLRKVCILAFIILIVFWFFSANITAGLKIPSLVSGYILAILLFLSLFNPVLLGALQGLERFGWFITSSLTTGFLKLVLIFFLIAAGFGITGALNAFMISALAGIIIAYLPVKSFITIKKIPGQQHMGEVLAYMVPVAVSTFCYMGLVNLDMILVKYFFSPLDSGMYSLAQMAGKIFFFLPGAISLVLFPRTAGLNAKKLDTLATLHLSLKLAAFLCLGACVFYNLFPAFVLRLLVGKVFAEAIFLGRLFSISMSFFALAYILITYFLSLKDLRFIKYLVGSLCLEVILICLFHRSLAGIQLILCVNSFILFSFLMWLKKRK